MLYCVYIKNIIYSNHYDFIIASLEESNYRVIELSKLILSNLYANS